MAELVLGDRAEREVLLEERRHADPLRVLLAHQVLVVGQRQERLAPAVDHGALWARRRSATSEPSLWRCGLSAFGATKPGSTADDVGAVDEPHLIALGAAGVGLAGQHHGELVVGGLEAAGMAELVLALALQEDLVDPHCSADRLDRLAARPAAADRAAAGGPEHRLLRRAPACRTVGRTTGRSRTATATANSSAMAWRPAGVMRSGVQTGSVTKRTSTRRTSSSASTAARTSSAIIASAGHPLNVGTRSTSTRIAVDGDAARRGRARRSTRPGTPDRRPRATPPTPRSVMRPPAASSASRTQRVSAQCCAASPIRRALSGPRLSKVARSGAQSISPVDPPARLRDRVGGPDRAGGSRSRSAGWRTSGRTCRGGPRCARS